MKTFRFQFKDQLTSIEENLDRYLKNKTTDCILYAEDGSKFKIHQEVLGQTHFLREILFSTKEHCCQIMEILVPCSKKELSHLVNFLYDGEIRCKEEKESLKILENLNKLFGFDESLDFQNNHEEPFQADESFCSSTDTELLGDKEEALDNVVVIPIVKSINPIQRGRKKSGGAKRRLFVENDVASATVLGDKKTQVRTILPYSKDSAEYLEWKKTQPRKAEKSNERAENNKNLSTKNVYDFVEEPIEKSINTIQSWRKLQKSGGAKRMLFEGNNVALATVLGDTGTLSSSDPVIAQSTSQHLKKNPSEKPKKKPESKFKCDRSNDKVGDNESENPEFLELRNKKNKKCEEQYEKWRNSAEYLDWKKTEKRPTSTKPQKKVQTDTNLSTKAEPEVGNSKKRKISETFANRRKKIHDD